MALTRVITALVLASGCAGSFTPSNDGGDASTDAAGVDALMSPDASAPDAGPLDALRIDARPLDGLQVDAAAPDVGPLDAGPPDASACDDDPSDGVTELYVISAVAVPISSPPPAAGAFGHDLDGVDDPGEPGADGATPACERRASDFTSRFDPGERGVDNQLRAPSSTPLIDPTETIEAAFQRQAREGSLLLVIRVEDVDDLTQDCSVSVSVSRVQVPGGGVPILAGTELAPGQTFASGTLISPAVRGAIVAGRLRVEGPSVPLFLGLDATPYIGLSRQVLDADISSELITRGNVGGAIAVADLVALAETLGVGEVVLSFWDQLADLDFRTETLTVGGVSVSRTGCGGLSVGFGFSAIDVAALDP